jgi:hypothetical protein
LLDSGPESIFDAMADYTLVEPMDTGIKKLMDDYFDVLHFQDMDLFDKVFHKECVLYSAQGGELSIRPYTVYREAVSNRKSPHELGESRNDKVLMIDQISPTLALVKPQLTMFGGLMQDYLNLVFLDEQWWVMAKMWEKVGDA